MVESVFTERFWLEQSCTSCACKKKNLLWSGMCQNH